MIIKNTDIYVNLSKLYEKSGNKNKSLNVLKTAAEMNPEDKLVIYTLANIQKIIICLMNQRKIILKLIQLDEKDETKLC